MRFVALHHGDLAIEDLWAGTPINIIRGLRKLGHEVEIVDKLLAVPYTWRVRAKIGFYRYLRRKFYIPTRDPRVMRGVARRANRRLHDLGPVDAILCTFPADAAYVELSAPLLVIHDATWKQLQNFYPGSERLCNETVEGGILLDKLAYSRCSHAFLSSQWAMDSVVRDYGVASDKLTVVPFGANMTKIPEKEAIPQFLKRRGAGPMKLLFLGGEWSRKGGDIAVAIAHEIRERGIAVELHVVGCTPPASSPSFVKPHGRLYKTKPEDARRLLELFEASDFMVLPTRADAYGIVFSEAAAYGLPVMTSDVGGVKSAVSEPWGVAFPPQASPSEFADWAVPLYLDRERYESVVRTARLDYEQKIDWTVCCNILMDRLAETGR